MTPAQPALDAMMEGVTRYFLSDPYDAATMQPELPPFSLGEWVAATDYNALAAEVRAQRETIAGLTARLEAMTKVLGSFKFSCNEASFYKDCALEFISPHSALFRLPITSDKAFLVAGLEARRLAALSGEAPND
jgi:hypothetical protein